MVCHVYGKGKHAVVRKSPVSKQPLKKKRDKPKKTCLKMIMNNLKICNLTKRLL